MEILLAIFRIHAISLGQGQGPVAEKLITGAVNAGDWVFLQVIIPFGDNSIKDMGFLFSLLKLCGEICRFLFNI